MGETKKGDWAQYKADYNNTIYNQNQNTNSHVYFFDDNESNCKETKKKLGTNATVYHIQNVIKQ